MEVKHLSLAIVKEEKEREKEGRGRDDFTFKIRKLKVNLLRNAEKIIMFVARSLFHQEV